ncbi:ABC transporter ATP-binding protein [Clostridioides difficile]|uniref:ABC transporter ATP-binding protein n=1 Tax=Clostridioides difficile TaxID=1496 RepID=UPI00038CBCB3|nr:ATP-binding cassette domain-containing protein [Clostridioides difficile]EQI09055.1 ABC transporter family protein [Clostridioides difficile Y21]EQK14440.1 ABC transporter family protein [Clostridioides difficile P72]
MSFLQVKNVGKSYGQVKVLKDISIDIEKGEFICLLGPSGCGKSTLLRIIAGLEDKHGGKIIINDKDMTNSPPESRNFGIVFQSYALFPNMNVYKNIAFGLENKNISKSNIDKKVKEVLEVVELSGYEKKYPSQLSGGQQQRVALARAIALEPDFLLLDEPLSALDAKVRLKLREQIKSLHRKLGITTIMVTHDQEEALCLADKMVVMNNGEVIQIGTPKEVYKSPKTPFVADFIGTINFIDDDVNMIAIRPEDIKVEFNRDFKEIDVKVGEILDIEFRGFNYRITVEYCSKQIKLDVVSKVVEQMKLCVGSKINFKIPKERTIQYKSEGCA